MAGIESFEKHISKWDSTNKIKDFICELKKYEHIHVENASKIKILKQRLGDITSNTYRETQSHSSDINDSFIKNVSSWEQAKIQNLLNLYQKHPNKNKEPLCGKIHILESYLSESGTNEKTKDIQSYQELKNKNIELKNKYNDAFVRIQGLGTGSGFYIAPNIIMTAKHVITTKTFGLDLPEVVRKMNGKRVYVKQIINIPGKDLTILIMKGKNKTIIPLGKSVQKGDKLHHFGMGKESWITGFDISNMLYMPGITSGISEYKGRSRLHNKYGSTNSFETKRINHFQHSGGGDSGGPWINNEGEVIGIHTNGIPRVPILRDLGISNISDYGYFYGPEEIKNAISYAKRKIR